MATKTIYPTGPAKGRSARRTPVGLLHGFTQNLGVLEPFGRLLAELAERRVVLVDLPGHGGSSGIVLDLDECADLLAEMLEGSALVGYSLGGRLALTLARRHPRAMAAIAVVGANPGLADPDDRAERLANDRRLAERLAAVGDPAQLRSFLASWLGNPLFGGIAPEVAGVEARLANRPGPMAEMLVATSLGAQEDLWGAAARMEIPALYLYGERDEKFSALAIRYCAGSGGRVRCAAIPGAAHYAIGEAPYATARMIAAFLDEAGLP
ncbi:MAG: alpha/beta fold hydrolase [Actinomycetota bacterium]|nr:alpha/beta fold hydrolase [Actinomycetota bacterium]